MKLDKKYLNLNEEEIAGIKDMYRKGFRKALELSKKYKNRNIGSPEQFRWVKKYGR